MPDEKLDKAARVLTGADTPEGRMSEEDAAIMDTTIAHDQALLAFTLNLEFAQQLVQAQGSDSMAPEAKTVLVRWLGIQIDGADAFIDAQKQADNDSRMLFELRQKAVEASDWLNELMPPGSVT